MGKVAELEFITAPHLIPSDKPEEQVGDVRSYTDLMVILPGPVRLVVLSAWSDL